MARRKCLAQRGKAPAAPGHRSIAQPSLRPGCGAGAWTDGPDEGRDTFSRNCSPAGGGDLPVVHALRGLPDAVPMQDYNPGTQRVYDGHTINEKGLIGTTGTPDFVVALTGMLIRGLPVGLNPKIIFPGPPRLARRRHPTLRLRLRGGAPVGAGIPLTAAAHAGGFHDSESLNVTGRSTQPFT